MSQIDTGGMYTAQRAGCVDDRPVQNDKLVLFDAASTFTQSGVFIVRANNPLMIVGYEVPDGAVFTVEGVNVGSRAVQSGGGCCSPCGPTLLSQQAADILFREPMTLGGNIWQITATKRRLLITLPGEYILSLNEDQYFGSVHVEVKELGVIPTEIPDAYVAGIQA